MSKLRDQGRFERVGWQLKILAPFWIVQLGLSLAVIGVFAHQIAETVLIWESNTSEGFPALDMIWEGTNVALALVYVGFIVAEIIRMAEESLTPSFMLSTHVFRLTCSGGILGLNIYFSIRGGHRQYTFIGMVLGGSLLAVTLGTLIYSIVTFHRLRKYEDYHLTGGVKQYGYRSNDVEMGNSVQIAGGARRSTVLSMAGGLPAISATPPEHDDDNDGEHHHDHDDRDPDNAYYDDPDRAARTSLGSPPPGRQGTTAGGLSAAAAAVGGAALPRDRSSSGGSEAYDHRRDTLYDSYLERHSGVPLQAQAQMIDRTVAAEFGWGSAGSGPRPSLERFGSVVGTGEVRAATAGPATDVVARESERGSLRGPEDVSSASSYAPTPLSSGGGGVGVGSGGGSRSSRSGGSSASRARNRARSGGSDMQNLLLAQHNEDDDGGGGHVPMSYGDSPHADGRPLA